MSRLAFSNPVAEYIKGVPEPQRPQVGFPIMKQSTPLLVVCILLHLLSARHAKSLFSQWISAELYNSSRYHAFPPRPVFFSQAREHACFPILFNYSWPGLLAFRGHPTVFSIARRAISLFSQRYPTNMDSSCRYPTLFFSDKLETHVFPMNLQGFQAPFLF